MLGSTCKCIVRSASKCPFSGLNYKVLNWPFDMQIVRQQWPLTWGFFCCRSNRSSIWFGSCGKLYRFKRVNSRRSFTSWRMLWTIVYPLRGLWLVCNKILLLLIEKRISKDSGGLTRIPLGKVFCAFLKSRTSPSHVVFSTEFAWISGGFILFLVNRYSGLLFWVGLLWWLIFRRRSLFLILLILATGFLCRLHRVYHSG